MDKLIDFNIKSNNRYKTFFDVEIHFLNKNRIVQCKFDTGAEVTVLGLAGLEEDEIEREMLKEKIIKNGKAVEGINSYSGKIENVFELPVTSIKIADEQFENISICVALDSEKSVIGMDLAGLFDFKYYPDKHVITYEKVRNWVRNPNIKYTIARDIVENSSSTVSEI